MSLEFYSFTKEQKGLSIFTDVVRAIALAALTFMVLHQLPFYPAGILLIGIAIVGVTLFIETRVSVLLSGVLILIPLFYYYPTIAILFAIAFSASFEFLSRHKGDSYLVLLLAVVASFFRFELAFPILAAYYLGSAGAIVAVLICLAIEIVGLIVGQPLLGTVSTGQHAPMARAAALAAKDFKWVVPHFKSLKVSQAVDFGKLLLQRPYLILQPIIWGGAIALLGRFAPRKYSGVWLGAIAGGFTLAIVQVAMANWSGVDLPATSFIGASVLASAVSGAWLSASLYLGQTQKEVDSVSKPEAILVLDLCGSTEMGDKFGDRFTFEMKKELGQIVDSAVEANQIFFKKGTGGGYLMAFPNARSAIKSAREILHKTRLRNERVEEEKRMHLRFGGTFGEVQVARDGDRFGTAVNMAFRFEGIKWDNVIDASVEEVTFPLYDRVFVNEYMAKDIENIEGLGCSLIGYCEVKGLSGRHPLYKVSPKHV